MNGIYVIPVNGLASGKNEFNWRIGNEFFEEFGNTEILGAQLAVRVVAQKSGRSIAVDFEIEGTLAVVCDRCLSRLEIPVHPQVRLSVGFSEEETPAGEDIETIILPAGETELDMAQIIYDYACLALPIQRVHPEGGCDAQVAGYIGRDTHQEPSQPDDDNPFAALKGMFN